MGVRLMVKSIADIMLEATIEMIKDNGLQRTIMDRANDREFCRQIGVDYLAENIYTQIRTKVEEYNKRIGGK